jgi:hypothetical protein
MNVIRWPRIALALAAAVFLAVSAAFAQMRATPRYDPKTEVTLKGTIMDVTEQAGPRGRWTGTHLMLKTDAQTIDVHIGPTRYLEQEKIHFSKGDTVEVTGSRVKIDNADVLLAREIKMGDRTVTLRNAEGVPVWSRGRRK